jgi:hypothetical protein
MTGSDHTIAEAAESLMKAHRYDEAIAGFELRLADDPNDLAALLRMGLCHLLNRSEAAFLEIHQRAEGIIRQLGEIPERVGRLWSQYQQLVHSVTATALVVGGMAATTACSDDATSSHRYSGGVYLDAGPADANEQDAMTSSHRYSGGVYLDAGSAGGKGQGGSAGEAQAETSDRGGHGGASGAENAASSNGGQGGASGAGQAGASEAGQGNTASAHRYSGGVYLDAGED